MDEEFPEYDGVDELDEIELPLDNDESTWNAELENFNSLLRRAEIHKECTQCKESIVSWDGKYLFCVKKAIIVKFL